MNKLNGVKIRIHSVKECQRLLRVLFENGHAWRGGSTDYKLSEYEVNSLCGLYIKDTTPDDFYQQKSAITFEESETSLCSDKEHLAMTVQQVLDYYQNTTT